MSTNDEHGSERSMQPDPKSNPPRKPWDPNKPTQNPPGSDKGHGSGSGTKQPSRRPDKQGNHDEE